MALHLTGGQGVVGSNPASPTGERPGIPTVPGLPYVQQPSPGAHTGAHIGQRPPLIPEYQALCTSPGGSQMPLTHLNTTKPPPAQTRRSRLGAVSRKGLVCAALP